MSPSNAAATQSYVIRRAAERGLTETDWLKSRHSFSFGDYFDPKHHHWGALRVINEDWIKADTGFGTHPHQDMEIVTWMVSGTLKHQDSLGNGTVIPAGDIQRMSAGTGIQHSEWNPSPDEGVHLLQIWIRPEAKGITPSYEQKTVGHLKAGTDWILVASQDGGEHAVKIYQQGTISYSGQVESSLTLKGETGAAQKGWLQVIFGQVAVGEDTLLAGDAIGVEANQSLDFHFEAGSQALWFVVPETH